MKPKKASGAATPNQIREVVLFDDPARFTDAPLLVLLLGNGTSRHGKGQVKKTWTSIELADDLLAESGGRLDRGAPRGSLKHSHRVDCSRDHRGRNQ